MHPYENIFGFDWQDVEKLAEKTMARGWTADFFASPVAPGHWMLDDQSQRSRNYHIHSWDMLDPLLAAHSRTGEQRWLAAAMPVALAWTERFANDEARADAVGAHHMAWYDMAVGLRAYRLAYLIEAGRAAGMLAPEQDEALWRALLLHVDYLADDDNFRAHNNHGFYQAAGQLAMGRRFAALDPELEAAHRQGEERFAEMLRQQFAADGTHREHSPDYHRMVYRTAKSMVDAGLVRNPAILAFLATIEQALSWFILPSGHIANIGDSDSHQYRLTRQDARRQWSTPQMRYVMARGVIGEPPATPYALFEEGGYVAARIPATDDPRFISDSYLVQQAGFHSRTHKHADTLSFLWSDREHRILVDAGRYGYLGKTAPGSELHKQGFWYSDPYRIYCESTRAHNCLEFDGRNYPRKGVEPYGSAVGRAAQDAKGRVVAFETRARHFEGLDHVRLLFLCGGEWLLCLDWFIDEADTPHDAAQWFHFAPGIETTQVGPDAFEARLPRHDVPLQVRSLLEGVDGAVRARGQREPILQGWWSRGYRKIEPIDALALRLSGRSSGTLATLFQFGAAVEPSRAESHVDAAARKGVLAWAVGGTRHRLRFDRPEQGNFKVDYKIG